MQRAARGAALLVGFVLITLLVARLPDDVFGATQALLLMAAGALVLLAAASVFLVPARRLQAAMLLTPARSDAAGVFGMATPEEVRAAAKPVLMAIALVAVAGVAAALR